MTQITYIDNVLYIDQNKLSSEFIRNTIKLVDRTIIKFKINKNFRFAMTHSEIPINRGRTPIVFSIFTTDKTYESTFPSFIYEGFTGFGINDYESYCSGFVDTTPSSNMVGWCGAIRCKIRHEMISKSATVNFLETINYNQTNKIMSFNEQINRWKYLIDVHGTSWSGRLMLLLRSPRIVFMVDRRHEEWFFPFMEPWKHYVPIKQDFSDLEENYNKIESDINLQNYIKENQKIFANQYLTRDAALYKIKEIIEKLPQLNDNTLSKNTIPIENIKTNVFNRQSWNNVINTWNKAESFLSSITSRGIIDSAKDILNIDGTDGQRVSDEVYNERKLSCFGNGSDILQCQVLKYDTDGKPFCGACGCKSNKLAILTPSEEGGYSKLHYPYLECPLKKKGFSNYEQ